MKKLIAIFSLLIMVLAASAQDITIRQNDFRATYTGTAADTLNASRILTKSVYVDKDYFYYVNVQVEADSSGDGNNVSATLQGSWDNVNFYNIGSATTWAVSAEDTAFSLNSFTATETIASHLILASDAAGFDASDTLTVAAQTITKTVPGLIYPYLRVYFLGAAAGSDMELTKLRFRFIKAY